MNLLSPLPRTTLRLSLLALAATALLGAIPSYAAVLSIANVATLRSTNGSSGDTAVVAGYNSAGDGGGGTFAWDSSSTAGDDGGMVFATSGGRWIRQASRVDVRMFGAQGSAPSQDTHALGQANCAAIQAAIDFAVSSRNNTVHFGGLRYYLYGTGTEADVTVYGGARVRSLLRIGYQSENLLPRISLLGEGAQLYTDDERSDFSVRPSTANSVDWRDQTNILFVLAKLKSLDVKDLTFERKITGGRSGEPGNYQSQEDSENEQPLSTGQLDWRDKPTAYNRHGISVNLFNGNEEQIITYPETPGSPTFTITFAGFTGQTTAAIRSDAPATGVGSVQAALDSLLNTTYGFAAGTAVAVTGEPRKYVLSFKGPLAKVNLPAMTVTGSAGVTPSISTRQHGVGNEVQKLTLANSGGTFTPAYNGVSATGGALSFTSGTAPTAVQLQTKLDTIAALTGNVTVIGPASGPFDIIFNNALGKTDVVQITAATTGGTTATPETEANGDNGEVEHIGFNNLTFIDCHRAFNVGGIPTADPRPFIGKIVDVNVENCRFLFPWGANSGAIPAEGGGGQATVASKGVKTMRFVNCLFDGASNGNLSTTNTHLPLDGFIFGDPVRLIATGNKLRHFDIEGIAYGGDLTIFIFWMASFTGTTTDGSAIVTGVPDGYGLNGGQIGALVHGTGIPDGTTITGLDPGAHTVTLSAACTTNGPITVIPYIDITMPAAGDETPELFLAFGSVPDTVSVGERFFLGDDAETVGEMELSWISTDRRHIKLRNPDPAILGNISEGTTVRIEDTCHFRDLTAFREGSCIIVNNDIDGTPAVGSAYGGYGNPAIRIDASQATITGNTIVNNAFGIYLQDHPFSQGVMRGSIVSNNYIRLPETGPSSYFDVNDMWATGIWLHGVEGVTVEGNKIIMPSAARVTGISITANNNILRNNTITALASPTPETAGWGFSIAHSTTGNIFDGNRTENLGVGIGLTEGSISDETYRVVNHTSVNDIRGVDLSRGSLYERQNVSFQPAESGWYRILSLPWDHLVGDLEWSYLKDGADMSTAQIGISFESYSFRNLVQKSFTDDYFGGPQKPPIIDQVILAGGHSPLLFVHVTHAADVPISMTWTSHSTGAGLLDQPVFQSRAATEVEVVGSDLQISTDGAHGLTAGHMFFLFGLPRDSHLNGGYRVTSVVNSTTFKVPIPTGGATSGSFAGYQQRTGVTTNLSSAITGLSDTTGLFPGLGISGNGIPEGAFVTVVPSSSSINISSDVSVSANPATLTFSGPAYFDDLGDDGGIGNANNENTRHLVLTTNGVKSLEGFGLIRGPDVTGVTPDFIGQNYLNWNTGELFVATGLFEADWKKVILNGGTASLSQVSLGAGNASTPSLNFGGNGDSNTGIFQPGVGSVGIGIDGSLVARFDQYGINTLGGAVDHVGYGFEGGASDGTGIYLKSASPDVIGIAISATERATISASGVSAARLNSPVLASICQGRLTLTTGTPVLTSSVTNAGTVYFTPFKGDSIALYDGSTWQVLSFSERSITLSSLTASTTYDVWAYISSGAVAVDTTAWTNSTTRATSLAFQNGVRVKSGDATRRYLGSITLNSSKQCSVTFGSINSDGSQAGQCDIWNEQNRIPIEMMVGDTTDSWTYTTATWRPSHNSTNNRVTLMIGMPDEPIHARALAYAGGSTAAKFVGVGLDSTSSSYGLVGIIASIVNAYSASAEFSAYVTGSHFVQWLEKSNTGGGTTTWYGDNGGDRQSGLIVNWNY
jgi:parallel beta-helix repeat protein